MYGQHQVINLFKVPKGSNNNTTVLELFIFISEIIVIIIGCDVLCLSGILYLTFSVLRYTNFTTTYESPNTMSVNNHIL